MRLREIIEEHGWPDTELAGEEGTRAAAWIAFRATREPDFQRRVLALIQEKVREGRVPVAQEAYLGDRIAMYEGRPQRYGTQGLLGPDGQYRRWTTEDPDRLKERRSEAGLPSILDDPPPSTPTAESLAEYEEWSRDYEEWLRRAVWRK